MEKPISVGDLVQVVRGHKCMQDAMGGVPFRVTAIHAPPELAWNCHRCKGENVSPRSAYTSFRGMSIPIPYLKRIPPIEELETTRTEDEVTA